MNNIKLTKQEIKILNKINKGEITSIMQFPIKSNINFMNYIGYDMTKGKYYLDEKGKQLLKENNKLDNPNILQIPTKFHLGQTVYTIRKIKPKNSCSMCKGTGKNISNKLINIVCDDEFTIKIINPNIDKDGVTVKYKIESDILTLKRAEENLFLSKKEAQAKCDELNNPRIAVKISDIVISNAFKNSKPSAGKILKKLDHYNRYGKFNTDITLDKDNILIDGYINYLICQLLHIDTIKVIIKDIKN